MTTDLLMEEAQNWEAEVNDLIEQTNELLQKIAECIATNTVVDTITESMDMVGNALKASFTILIEGFQRTMEALASALSKFAEIAEKIATVAGQIAEKFS